MAGGNLLATRANHPLRGIAARNHGTETVIALRAEPGHARSLPGSSAATPGHGLPPVPRLVPVKHGSFLLIFRST